MFNKIHFNPDLKNNQFTITFIVSEQILKKANWVVNLQENYWMN